MREHSTLVSDGVAVCLLDVVVLAGGESLDLKPLNAFESKNMLRVCNRPLIWYCLTPWIEAGFRTFFLCVNEDYATLHAYLTREFSAVEFHFVLVPLVINDHPSTTCDAVKSYVKYKELMRLGGSDGDIGKNVMASPSGPTDGDDPARCIGGTEGGSANAHRKCAGRDTLKAEHAALAALHRDALLLSCDTILAGVDVERFVSNFYASLASVSALFFRPYVPPALPPTLREKKGKKGDAGATSGQERKTFAYSYTCLAYEEDDTPAPMSISRGTGKINKEDTRDPLSPTVTGVAALATADEDGAILQHRMHYMYPFEENPEVRITMAFAARRPNLTFVSDVVDAHVYIVRHWVLDFIAEWAGIPDESVRKSIIPLLARSQHTTVNRKENAFITPSKKINHVIPTHWMVGKHMCVDDIQGLSSALRILLPGDTDNLRVFCSIVEEHPNVPRRIYRVNTRDNFQAISQEIVSAQCHHLHLLTAPQTWLSPSPPSSFGLYHHNSPPVVNATASFKPHEGNPLGAEGSIDTADSSNNLGLSSSVSALALMLPSRAFTLKQRIGNQQMHIMGSFLESVPSPNTYITRSVIGPNVTIGEGARIVDSIILGSVEIGTKAVITNSVVGTGAVISTEKRVCNSFVAPRCYVEEDVLDRIMDHES